MKRKSIPQFDLRLPDEPFALVVQSTVDGDRVATEQMRHRCDRATSDSQQLPLLQPKGPHGLPHHLSH